MRNVIVSLLVLITLGCCTTAKEDAVADPDLSRLMKDTSNPFPARIQSWELGENHDPELILVDNTYYMFYAGAAVSGTAPLRIGVQTTPSSSYPYGWTKHASNPVLDFNTQSMDTILISSPHPIRMQDNSFRLYYHGYNGTKNDLGFATTTSGSFPTGWTKYAGNPIFTRSVGVAWDNVDLRPAEIIIPAWSSPDNTWHLLYGGFDGTNWRGGHATSTDGIAWTRVAGNPVMTLGTGSAWDNHDVLPTGWFKSGSTYYILYQGSNNAKWEIGYFTTTDFVTFTRGSGTGGPIITVGAAGQWDHTSVENPGAVYHAATDTVDLWYVGTDNPFVVNGSSNYRIGLARILNLTNWFSGGTLAGGTIR